MSAASASEHAAPPPTSRGSTIPIPDRLAGVLPFQLASRVPARPGITPLAAAELVDWLVQSRFATVDANGALIPTARALVVGEGLSL